MQADGARCRRATRRRCARAYAERLRAIYAASSAAALRDMPAAQRHASASHTRCRAADAPPTTPAIRATPIAPRLSRHTPARDIVRRATLRALQRTYTAIRARQRRAQRRHGGYARRAAAPRVYACMVGEIMKLLEGQKMEEGGKGEEVKCYMLG